MAHFKRACHAYPIKIGFSENNWAKYGNGKERAIDCESYYTEYVHYDQNNLSDKSDNKDPLEKPETFKCSSDNYNDEDEADEDETP